jgi:hypothetical protein
MGGTTGVSTRAAKETLRARDNLEAAKSGASRPVAATAGSALSGRLG